MASELTKVFLGVVLGLFLGGCSGRGEPVTFKRLPVEQSAELAKKSGTFILDARSPEEFAQGHLAGAVLLPVGELPRRLSELPKDKTTPVLVYCGVGPRAQAASRLLVEQGYSSVHELKGGITAWIAEDRPIVR